MLRKSAAGFGGSIPWRMTEGAVKKVRLDLDHLAVDSFPTAEGAVRREQGTVHAQARCTYWNTCVCDSGLYKCGTQPSISCDYTGSWCEP